MQDGQTFVTTFDYQDFCHMCSVTVTENFVATLLLVQNVVQDVLI